MDELRRGPWWLPRLSLVAVSATGAVIGHVLATRASLEPSGTAVLGLAPLGIDPAHQGRGVGTALMHAILAAAEACDEPLVALLGAPAYYRRFGFSAAAGHGIAAPDPTWAAAFQARVLSGTVVPGRFRYAPPFDRLT
ncbi:GNAT family N-acetyltransferase [Pseudonocardia asaccharolytica]|uniref:N-acetyltransferase n=1 Tax=Pseudonocardia asaccharolytica DSM 44247 = NBRC 16224 TaxID=1123024 RepID=A0A511CX02_9PSEU|nr:N-acetyltransferase [Pseudonocardia asaccharolytica]GEL17007.1 N-acetyltransferase [Pseudonocardia asaccharolytica DSM 44247 = NBRC 16224]